MTEHAQAPFEKELMSLKELALRMGRLAEAILADSLQAVFKRDAEIANQVGKNDLEIDRLDVEIDCAVLEFLALRAPVAQDLRLVIAIKTAAMDLERVGDLARNIAKSALRLAERPKIAFPPGLQILAGGSQRLLGNALSALADQCPDRAREVLAADDEVDAEQDRVVREAIEEIRAHPEISSQEVDLIFIAKNLERVGDHATNIAEDVILAAESVNLKHAKKLSGRGQ